MSAEPTGKAVSLFVILLWASTFASCAKKSAPVAGIDLNGGFEDKAPDRDEPNGWYAARVPRTANHVIFGWEDEVAHSGRHSASIAIKDSHPEDTIAYNWTRTVKECMVGKTYEIDGWVKTENLTGPAWIVVQCWDKDRRVVLRGATTQRSHPITGTSDWTLVKTSFTVPTGTEDVLIRVGVAAPGNIGGKAWFDDLRVSEKSD